MPQPTTVQVPIPLPTVATPSVTLPCGIKIPSIPVLAPFSVSITIPGFPPGFLSKKGPRKSRTASKWVERLKKLNKLCPGLVP